MKKIFYTFLALFLVNCVDSEEKKNTDKQPPKKVEPVVETPVLVPTFNQDSAYYFIQKQVDFGPRVPNTKAHIDCGNYLSGVLKNYGALVIEQTGTVKAFNGAELNIKNIIGQFYPEKENRIMLFAHWDTRPFADRDTKNQSKPIDGANDGASGVGVLLEIARLIGKEKTNVGVDIIFFDAEDYGAVANNMYGNKINDDWCLGTQYWAKNPPIENYRPKYGILLDMVGAKNAVFPKEYISMYFAPDIVNKVWEKAHALGYGRYFINKEMPPETAITDDHKYVNILAKIPAIDIIHYDPTTYDFGEFHHTHKDNMEVIDKNTLKAVGHTLVEIIYREK